MDVKAIISDWHHRTRVCVGVPFPALTVGCAGKRDKANAMQT